MSGAYHIFHPSIHQADPALIQEEKKVALPGVMGGIFLVLTDSLSIFWAINFYAQGLSGKGVGLLFAIAKITALLVTLPGGLLNDRLRAKYIIGIGLILTIMQMIGSSLTAKFGTLCLLFFIGGVGQTIFNTSIDAVFYKSISARFRDQEIGLFLSLRIIMIGLGSIFLGSILSVISFPKLLQIIAVVFLLLIAICFKLPSTKASSISLKSYKQDLVRPEVLFFLLTILLFAFHEGMETVILGQFLKSTLGFSSLSIGLYLGLTLISMALTIKITSAKLQQKKVTPQKILIRGLYFSALGLLTMAYPIGFVSFLGRLVHVTGDAFIYVALYHDVSSFFPAKRLGGDSSLITLTILVGTFLGSLAYGSLSSYLSYSHVIVISSLVSFFTLGLMLIHKQKFIKKAPIAEVNEVE